MKNKTEPDDIDIEKVLDEFVATHPEYKREIFDEAVELSIAGILSRLFLNNAIDESRTDDLKYIWELVIQNLYVLESLPMIRGRFDEELLETAREAAQADKIPVVVILIATVIEHRLNIFYRDVLEDYSGLSSSEATEAIRSNVSVKLGWLFHLTTRGHISDELTKQIKQIFDLRNAFVHYKSTMVTLNETNKTTELIDRVKDIGLENILGLPDKIDEELAKVVQKLVPAYQKAYKLAAAMSAKHKNHGKT